jgi:glycosyltransferase involved in cell wall biosynthesis
MSKTLLVITTYNQSEYTKLCFDSLKNLEDDIDVLVIDDCSTDDTVKICKEYGYEVITKEEGLGLTDSWNRGYYEFKSRWFNNESGFDDNYDYFILANNDILIPKGAITELKNTFAKWPFSLVVPTSTTNGVGHNTEQSIENHYQGMSPSCDDPNYYQEIQDKIFDVKTQIEQSNNLYQLDPKRMKMFNGFFFMMNRNIINYEHSDKELFEPKFIMTKNEDEFNWSNLIPNNDFAGLCKTSFVFHYKGVSTFKIFDNYGEMSNDVPKWKKQRELKGG